MFIQGEFLLVCGSRQHLLQILLQALPALQLLQSLSNTKRVVVKHLFSLSHKNNMIDLIKHEYGSNEIHGTGMVAGDHVFGSVYGGINYKN